LEIAEPSDIGNKNCCYFLATLIPQENNFYSGYYPTVGANHQNCSFHKRGFGFCSQGEKMDGRNIIDII